MCQTGNSGPTVQKLREVLPHHRADHGGVLQPPQLVREWAESRRSDQVFQEYRREYKRRFAWIKAGKLTEEQFAAWHKAAKARKKDCDREIISLDEFKSWLKNS